jgi:hypothetical protein
MENLGPARFTDVLDAFRANHPADREHPANTNAESEAMLLAADWLFGCWFRVLLARDEVCSVLLPWHLSEGGDRELVPPAGLTVSEAADRVRVGGDVLQQANPVCAAKIDRFRQAPCSTVHLSVGPVNHPDYQRLSGRAALTHLDGLHRMIAWDLAGRLSAGQATEAFVAGDPTGGRP